MFEWDSRKAAANLRKHRVSFDDAATAFGDDRALLGPDLAHSTVEPRWYLVGRALDSRVLAVTYTIRSRAHGETVRLITARRASRKERRAYDAGPRD